MMVENAFVGLHTTIATVLDLKCNTQERQVLGEAYFKIQMKRWEKLFTHLVVIFAHKKQRVPNSTSFYNQSTYPL